MADEPPITVTGPLTDTQILAMRTQEERCRRRKAVLDSINAELDSWAQAVVADDRSRAVARGKCAGRA